MNYYLIAPAKTFHSTDNTLTYASNEPLQIGQIVEIPLGKNTTFGIVSAKTTQPDFETKEIIRILYPEPLPKHLLKAIFWLSDYYRCPLSTVVQAALPRGITKKRRQPKSAPKAKATKSSTNPLNSAQKRAIVEINSNPANTILLHGITGSGKTNIYIELAKQTLAQNQSIILLVPEIALTSQLVRNFQAHFDNVILLHSAQTEAVRHQLWQKSLQSTAPQVIIGPRSALFAPVHDLGLVIIDEAHEPAYHQDQNPKYSALRLAAVMAKTILGSATPLVSDYYICKQRKAVIELNELAIKSTKTTEISVIDLKNRPDFTRSHLLSNQLISSIQKSLDQHTQSMIFHNRRGTAPLTICDQCGWQALCENCLLPLVLHADKYQMRCHTCGRTYPVPTACPECHNASIHHKGFGTKMLEEELHRLFPTARIARFDTDTETDLQLNKIYDQVHAGDYDIIVGTQMIAKGFDFPKITTLGIAQADAGLSLPDYSSEERTFQLINQVIGRANRGHQNSHIFIQSFQPDHPLISFAAQSDYAGFYKYLLQRRRQSTLPPYSFLLKLSLTYKTEKAAVLNTRKLNKKIIQFSQKSQLSQVSISPPMPAFHERSNTGFTWQIVVKAKSRKDLLAIFDSLDKNPHLHYDFDPISLL
ncbi:MAG: primosomal protein N' [Candidatus Saccharibacteria bacterium]|nr:primosomal protein N' [Candidatus Saccharibacteria bacterium]